MFPLQTSFGWSQNFQNFCCLDKRSGKLHDPLICARKGSWWEKGEETSVVNMVWNKLPLRVSGNRWEPSTTISLFPVSKFRFHDCSQETTVLVPWITSISKQPSASPTASLFLAFNQKIRLHWPLFMSKPLVKVVLALPISLLLGLQKLFYLPLHLSFFSLKYYSYYIRSFA